MHILLTALYVTWLLYVKPKSKKIFIAIQAGAAVFLGITALMIVSYDWIASIVVLLMWLVGYSAARHIVSSYDDPHTSFYSLLWGVVFAELGWLGYHWTFAYTIPGAGDIKLSQIALIMLAISFMSERAYRSYSKHGSIRSSDVIMPILLSVSVILILLTLFNTISTGTI